MALQRLILQNGSQSHSEAILDLLKAESPLTACISYCSAAQSGRELAHVILSTMQAVRRLSTLWGFRSHISLLYSYQMMNTRRTDTNIGERAILRRTLVRFSTGVQVSPLGLFLQELDHLEKEPRSIGDFADLSYGMWSGQYVAVKRLRTVQSDESVSSKNASVHP